MKKVYLSILALLFLGALNAQNFSEATHSPSKSKVKKESFNHIATKAGGTVLFSEDFVNGTASSNGNWARTGVDSVLWLHDFNGPDGNFSSNAQRINSPSAANGFMIFDTDFSNPNLQNLTYRDGAIESPSMNLNNTTNIVIDFWHKFRFCCAGAAVLNLEISVDGGTTWPEIIELSSRTSYGPNDESASIHERINISQFLNGKNVSNVKLRFNHPQTTNNSHYFWMIDDIKVIESYDYDATLTQPDQNFEMGAEQMFYPFIPLSQVHDVTFLGEASNNGNLTINNFHLEGSVVEVPSFTSTSNSVPLPPNATYSASGVQLFTPITMGTHTYRVTFLGDSADEYPIDNSVSRISEVNTYTFAKDDGNATGRLSNFTNNTGMQFEIGNLIEFAAAATIYAVDISIDNLTDTSVNPNFYGAVYAFDPINNTTTFLQNTFDSVISTASQLEVYHTLQLKSPVNVTAGQVIFVTAGHYGDLVYFNDAQRVPQGEVRGFDANFNLLTLINPNAPMVRLNLNPNSNPNIAPVAATNLTATPATFSSVDLTWDDNSANETGYEIERSDNTASNFVYLTTLPSNSTTYTDNGLTTNTMYYYRVRAVNSNGNSPYSNIDSALTLGPPPVDASSLIATNVSISQIDLSWTDNSSTELGFIIESSALTNANFNIIDTVSTNVTTYSSTGLATNTIYHYRVTAYNANGNAMPSNEAFDTTSQLPPAAPTTLVATLANPYAIDLTWVDNASDETGYSIERSANDTTNFSEIIIVAADETSYSDTSVSHTTTYFYRVAAISSNGASAYSNIDSATTPIQPPLAPTSLSATYSSSLNKIEIIWSDNANNEDNYELFRSVNDTLSFALYQTLPANTQLYDDLSFTQNTQYFYKVRAVGGGTQTSFSNVDSVIADPVGIEELLNENTISLYPNPVVVSNFALTFNALQINSVRIEILDVTGKIIDAEKEYTLTNNELILNTPSNKGVYFIHIKTAYGALSKKLIVQ